MATHSLSLMYVEYDDVKLEATLVMSRHLHGIPLPPGARDDLTNVSYGEVRIGPIKTSKTPEVPIRATWYDVDTASYWQATWTGSAWSERTPYTPPAPPTS